MKTKYSMSRAVFLRGLGIIYAVQFFGFARQARGLLGDRGILPVAAFLATERDRLGASALLHIPTVFWLDDSNGALLAIACAGLVAALAMVAGCESALASAPAWLFYSSFVSVGQAFTASTGDLLLLESGFLAILLSPGARWRARAAPPMVIVLLLRWLALRVLVGSGIAKLRSDPCWASLSCLPESLETGPVPTLLAYYLHALPRAVLHAATSIDLFAELVVPFGFFGPRRVRHTAAVIVAACSLLSGLTSNGDFASFVVIVLMAACVDDDAFRRLGVHRKGVLGQAEVELGRRTTIGILAAAASLFVLTLVEMPEVFSPTPGGKPSLEPLHLVNSYGVIQAVERERYEVVFEGTRDDVAVGPAHWLEYELPAKPGDPRRAPDLPSIYVHRLDARLFRASLGDFRREPWVIRVVDDLLRGNGSVTALFARDPFAGSPPRFVRAERFRYRFSRPGEAPYWQRERADEFIRPISLKDPALYEYLFRKGWL